jgi:outer membrane protein assembly factor BamD (BamD/ComL family)
MRLVKYIGLIGLIGLTAARGQISKQIEAASAPLSEGVAEVAVARLQVLLAQHSADSDWSSVAEKLGEALVAAKQPSDALKLLDDQRLRGSATAKFWRAEALANLHRPNDALAAYQEIVTGKNSEWQSAANFGAAEMLRALGRNDEALQKYSELFRDQRWSVTAQLRAAELYLDRNDAPNAGRLLGKVRPRNSADRKERQFLRGRLELVSGWPEKAIATFEGVLKRPANASHETLIATLFAIADAYLRLNAPETGDDILEDFIEHHPYDVDLARVFAKLEELYRAERKPSRSELDRWSRDLAEPRRALAQWYLARFDLRIGRRDRALEYFNSLRRGHPNSESLAPALLEFAHLQIQDAHYADAMATLDDAKSLKPSPQVVDRINFLIAETEYRSGRFQDGAGAFKQVAFSSPAFATMSMFNASMSALEAGNESQFLADAAELAKTPGNKESVGELRLNEGLLQASNGDKRAIESLQNFLREFPDNKRAAEAWVALAELAFHAAPPRLDEARKDLARAKDSKPAPSVQERADYLAIWIEDATAANDSKVIESCKGFLQNNQSSALAASVRMKLAEVYYRQQDFPNAQTQFQILVDRNQAGPFEEKALFFAAESAMSSMGAHSLEQAVELFDRVVKLNGELKWPARNEQAAIERKLGKPQDALVLYEEVLKGDARPAEKREALCGKGDIFAELGVTDPKNYQRAIEIYDQLASDRDEPIHWRNQALFKKGVCLEKQSDRAAALNAFYQVIENETRPDRPREFFWFYKAGFNAGRLLEADAKWQSAAAIYQKLAAASGPRSDEAKERVDRLRLEHFLREE